MSTRSTLEEIMPSLIVCAKSKVNVVTIAEEVLNSYTTSPELTKEIDALFRANQVTLTGSGFEDVAVGEMMLTLSSLMHQIAVIHGLQQYNLNEQDADFAEETANLTRSQILVQSGASVLAIANQNPQYVLSLLR